jgi:predicted GH43/DUF377 family glycosyl hydrolase
MDLFSKDPTPLLAPRPDLEWASGAIFNPGAWYDGERVHLLFRAIPAGYDRRDDLGGGRYEGSFGFDDYVSLIGYASSRDGAHFDVHPEPVLRPDTPADRWGCEDPRIAPLPDGRYAVLYTALSAPAFGDEEGVQIGLATTRDFRHFDKHGAISPPLRDKDAVLFPRPIGGRLALLHRVVPDIQLAWFEDAHHLARPGEAYWREHLRTLDEHVVLRPEMPWEGKKIGAGPTPIETDEGWLLIYHGADAGHVYRAGLALLDLDDPMRVIARAPRPVLEPTLDWEREGDVPNVVFPQGAVVVGGELVVYYGAADTRIGRAYAPLADVVQHVLDESKTHWRMPKIFMGATRLHEESPATLALGVHAERLHGGRPILEPHPDHDWEDGVVLNPAAHLIDNSDEVAQLCHALDLEDAQRRRLAGGCAVMLYRAQGSRTQHGHSASSLGLALFTPELEPVYRHPVPLIAPDERFHDLGVEDARLTRIGGTYYLYYTGYARPETGDHTQIGGRVRICLATSDDLLDWTLHGPVGGVNEYPNKNAVLLPDPVDGRYVLLHRPLAGPRPFAMHWAEANRPAGPWRSRGLLMASRRFDDQALSWVGAAGPPLPLGDGRFLAIYHQGHLGYDRRRLYNLSAALLDFTLGDPVVARVEPILLPTGDAETSGDARLGVDNVVFACAGYRLGGRIVVPYAGADSRIFGAAFDESDLMTALRASAQTPTPVAAHPA